VWSGFLWPGTEPVPSIGAAPTELGGAERDFAIDISRLTALPRLLAYYSILNKTVAASAHKAVGWEERSPSDALCV
jgi:hypothetical protein